MLQEREKGRVHTLSGPGTEVPSRSASAVGGRLSRWRVGETIPGLQSRLTKVVKLFKCCATDGSWKQEGSLNRGARDRSWM